MIPTHDLAVVVGTLVAIAVLLGAVVIRILVSETK